MNDPAVVEERDSERDLIHERFDHPAHYELVIIIHVRKPRPNDFEHQHVVFSVWALHLEVVQKSEDAIGSGMRPRPGRETVMNLDLVVPAGKMGYDELEDHVSATRWEDR